MSTRLGVSNFFFIVFVVLLFVGASEALRPWKVPVIIRDGVQINYYQTEEYDPIMEKADSASFGDQINEIDTNSAYYAYLHTKRLNIYGEDWLWRIDFLVILFCFSLLLTNLSFRAFFCITSICSARVSKS
ncbi:PREDICTED: uncharacterized protein LOC104790382 [Camelina sativa]|uniref:Uncharacterized protein LOC104790382 n=1 Tax=Camelina sativa TaxID=90675 RepID=A0ABM0ZDZ8_CAMSA|nr:PREDICTED: uncharacterized protein LOC104790382 [Camelina sativa]